MGSRRSDNSGFLDDPGEHFEPRDYDIQCAAEGCQRAITSKEAETRPTSDWLSTDDGKTWYCPEHADQA